ncbi:hypothetical protein HMPREF1097_06021, partial [Enterocloster bolteae 90B8]
VNDFLSTDEETVLSGPMGKLLKEQLNVLNTKIDKKATIYRDQTDMGGKYDSNTVSVKWGTDSYGNYYIYILVDGTAVCALPGWTRLD